jgi:protein phosphatase 1L
MQFKIHPTIETINGSTYRCISHIGRSNEDRYCTTSSNTLSIYCIFDGHGGSETSNYLKDNLAMELKRRLQQMDLNQEDQVKRIIVETFLDIDYQLYIRNVADGSTATISIVTPNKIYFTNLGDSRSLLYNDTEHILLQTNDHKPELPIERERIESNGGTISLIGVYRVEGQLAISRAFGDLFLKHGKNNYRYSPNGLVSTIPDIYVYCIKPNDRGNLHILMASDGLWDGVSNEYAIKLVQNHVDSHVELMNIAKVLTTDDITIMVIDM